MPQDTSQRGTTTSSWSTGYVLVGAWLDAVNSRCAQAVPVAGQLLRTALEQDDLSMAAKAEHVMALAHLNVGEWRRAQPHIDAMLEHLSRCPEPAFAAHAWVLRGACLAELDHPDAVLEALMHAELIAESATEPSDQLALAFSDMAIILGEMAQYEHAERMLTRAVDTAVAAGAPVAVHLFKRGRNLARWAMRLEHQGRGEQAAERYGETVEALQGARDADPDPRFPLESWVMTSVATLCRARSALITGERWRPPKSEAASPRWLVKSSHSYEDAQWRVHAAASVALVTDEPRHALALLDGLREDDYAVRGPRLGDRWHLYTLAYERAGDHAAALRAHRQLHAWYDEAAYRCRRERADAARARVESAR